MCACPSLVKYVTINSFPACANQFKTHNTGSDLPGRIRFSPVYHLHNTLTLAERTKCACLIIHVLFNVTQITQLALLNKTVIFELNSKILHLNLAR